MTFGTQRCLITGPHRSGTTWLGRVIGRIPGCGVLHEPFNLKHGLKGVPSWYPHPPSEGEETVRALLNELLHGKIRYTRNSSSKIRLKRAAVSLLGPRNEWHARWHRWRGTATLVLKDPFLLLAVPMLVEEFDFKIVILIRHPGAYYASLKRMGWSAPVGTLLAKSAFLERIDYRGDGYPPGPYPPGPYRYASEIGLMWRLFADWALLMRERYREDLVLLRHEDVALEPEMRVREVTALFGLHDVSAAVRYARESTAGATIVPQDGQLHVFERDATRLVHAWKSQLSADEIRILQEVTQGSCKRIYDDETWARNK